MKYVLLRDDKVVGIYDSSPTAMDAADEMRKKQEGWISKDLYPPFYVFVNARWRIDSVKEK